MDNNYLGVTKLINLWVKLILLSQIFKRHWELIEFCDYQFCKTLTHLRQEIPCEYKNKIDKDQGNRQWHIEKMLHKN